MSSFPTMLVRRIASEREDDAILVGGYRSLATYERVISELAPGLEKSPARSPPELVVAYGPLTSRELVEITGRRAAPSELAAEAAAGRVTRIAVRGGELWNVAAAAP